MNKTNNTQQKYDRWLSIVLLVFSLLLSTHIASGQANVTFDDLFFGAGYDIDTHWQVNGVPIYAIQSRPSNNIFILDQAFNVTAQLDPSIDTALMGVTAFGPKELAWSSDGNYLAVIHDSGIGEFVQIWNMTTLTPQTILTGIFQNLRWQPEGNILAVAEEQRGIIIYDVAQQQVRHEFVLPVGAFASDIEWKPDGSHIAGLNSQSVVQVWDVTSGSIVFQLNFQVEDIAGEKAFIDLTWSSDQNYLVIHDWTRGIEIWDTVNENLIDTLSTSTQPTIEWFEEGIVSYGLDTIEILDATNGMLKQTITSNSNLVSVERNPITGKLVYFITEVNIPFQDLVTTEAIIPFVTSFILINADTNQPIQTLNDSDTIDLPVSGTSNLAIRANTTPATVGSVIFDLSGTVLTDNTAPYEFTDWTPTSGAYTLTATPYSESGGAGTPLTISFTVVDNGVTCTTTIAASDITALISAIVTANSETEPQTICLEDSTYALTAAHNSDWDGANGLPVITGDITIVGNGAIIERASGAPAFRIFKVDSGGRLALEDVTIRGGDAGSDEGGGIYNAGTLELDGVTVADNQAEAGGGIASTGSLTAANSTIQDNTAYDGAGLLGDSGSSTTLTEVTISGNVAHSSWGLGGGVWLNGDLSMSGGSLSSNNARNGGGMFVNNAPNPVTLSNVTISNNGASRHGGGIYSNNGTVELDGVTFSGNIGLYFGGGIRNGDQMTVTSGDFSGNTGQDGGGGITTVLFVLLSCPIPAVWLPQYLVRSKRQ